MMRWIIVSLVAAAAGCAPIETGNPQQPATVTLRMALADAPAGAPPVATDSDGRAFPLAAARAHVRRIDLDLPDGARCDDLVLSAPAHGTLTCDQGTTIRLEGPWVVDLRAGVWSPSLAGFAVPAGVYRRVEVDFAPADPDEGLVTMADELAEHTLVASGVASVGGAPTPFAMRLAFTERARFESPTGIEVGAGLTQALDLLLDAASWLSDLPLGACADDGNLPVEPDGTVVLGDGQDGCSAVEGAIRDAIKGSGRLAE